MPPENRSASRMSDEDESERSEDQRHHGGMRRVISESEISISSDSPKNINEYRVRKSSLIGYVNE